MEEKIPDLHVRSVDRKVWEAFKTEAVRKHGKLHGVLGKELTKAMELYLEGYSQEECTRTHGKREKEEKKKKGNPGEKNPINKEEKQENVIKIAGNLADKVYNGERIKVDAFKRIIRGVRGIKDRRAVNDDLEVIFDEYMLKKDRKGYVRPMFD